MIDHAGSTAPGAPVRNLLEELAPHALALVWLGHASVLAALGDRTIAVDPVFSARIGPRIFGRTWGLSRRSPPPVPASTLAGIDLILLTHAHFDHLDRPTLRAIASDKTTVVAPERCASLVPSGFKNVVELSPGQSLDHGGVRIHALATRHWGARMVFDRGRGALAYAVAHEEGSILFAGDTAYTGEIARATEVVGPLDVAAFGVGAYNPWEHMHATPEQVWRMFVGLGARFLLPIHHSTFELSDEPLDEPLRRLIDSAGEDAARVLTASIGEIAVVSRAEVEGAPAPAVDPSDLSPGEMPH